MAWLQGNAACYAEEARGRQPDLSLRVRKPPYAFKPCAQPGYVSIWRLERAAALETRCQTRPSVFLLPTPSSSPRARPQANPWVARTQRGPGRPPLGRGLPPTQFRWRAAASPPPAPAGACRCRGAAFRLFTQLWTTCGPCASRGCACAAPAHLGPGGFKPSPPAAAGPAARRLNAPSATMSAKSSSGTPTCPCSRWVLPAAGASPPAGGSEVAGRGSVPALAAASSSRSGRRCWAAAAGDPAQGVGAPQGQGGPGEGGGSSWRGC